MVGGGRETLRKVEVTGPPWKLARWWLREQIAGHVARDKPNMPRCVIGWNTLSFSLANRY
jgi:hypothetical protein